MITINLNDTLYSYGSYSIYLQQAPTLQTYINANNILKIFAPTDQAINTIMNSTGNFPSLSQTYQYMMALNVRKQIKKKK